MIKTRFQFGEHELLAVQVLKSTYQTFNYLLCRAGKAVLIDAGEAKPVLAALDAEGLQLLNILITHNHGDHVGGCRALQDQLGVQSTSPGVESRAFEFLGTECCSLATPGHMAVCKSYHFPELGVVFTGDAIIGGGCGRILGGTPEAFFEGLAVLKALPDDTLVFGGHDYLEDNMVFALSVEPDNADMRARLERHAVDPAAAENVPLAEQNKTKPYLRAQSVAEFTELRLAKDRF